MTSAKRLFSGSNITCIRGGRVLFQNLSFGADPGDVIHLSGPNGSGKTSLLRILCGALPAADGEIKWNGKLFLENGSAVHSERLSFLPSDDRNLKPVETVLESLLFWSSFWEIKDAAAVCRDALQRMGILKLKDMRVRHLSAGQKRRLSLARVLIRKAPLWLLDEPLNGLDRASYDLFVREINVHCSIGGMAVIASHYTIEPPRHGTLRRLDLEVLAR